MKKYPKTLTIEEHFKTPIWYANVPEFVKELNKASDSHIKKSKNKKKQQILERNKKFNIDLKDSNMVHHSDNLLEDFKFKNLKTYVTDTSHNLLLEMGYDLTDYKVVCTELWVQEFPKSGMGNHSAHVHWNGHISGFYFLKANEKTSYPVFHDPRPGRQMIGLPHADKSKISYGSDLIHFNNSPGTMIFFPSYITHEFPVDLGIDTFRFIHWNCQAISKKFLNE